MSDTPKTREEQIAELRQQWLSYAGAAFDLMFHPDHQPDLVSLDQREQRACQSVDDLKAWLLQQHIAADPDTSPPLDQLVPCPHCCKPAKRSERADKPLFVRRLGTLGGEVAFTRAKWYCATCRVAFFPSGPQAPTRR